MGSQSKLVRDRIPGIIRSSGAEPVTYTAGPVEYRRLLRDKLGEEVAEFLAAADETEAREELADVLEVVLALASELGMDPTGLEEVRAAKARERGPSPTGSSGWAIADPVHPQLALRDQRRDALDIWNNHYNHYRPHGAAGGQPLAWRLRAGVTNALASYI